jgi:hypothetical protein
VLLLAFSAILKPSILNNLLTHWTFSGVTVSRHRGEALQQVHLPLKKQETILMDYSMETEGSLVSTSWVWSSVPHTHFLFHCCSCTLSV